MNRACRKRASCLVCGEKIPLIRHMTISSFNGAECPNCHSYMLFNRRVFLLQILLVILIFPLLNEIVEKHNYLFGFLGLFLLVCTSISVAYYAEYRIDPSHASRLPSSRKKQNTK